MSFLPEIENGALKKTKVVFKRRAHSTKPFGRGFNKEKKLGKKLWREWHKATDWIKHIT
jgi:hypothetical protein